MFEYQVNHPLSWPAKKPRTPYNSQKSAAFGVAPASGSSYRARRSLTVTEALGRVTSQLDKLTKAGQDYRTSDVVISTNLAPKGKKGQSIAGQAEPDDCGAAVYFKLDDKPVILACDKFDRLADNLAAIAAHIEATRAIERHGVATLEEAFAGYMQLPAPGETSGRPWWTVLGVAINASSEQIDLGYKIKAKLVHPDKGGTREQWDELQEAHLQAQAAVKGGKRDGK